MPAGSVLTGFDLIRFPNPGHRDGHSFRIRQRGESLRYGEEIESRGVVAIRLFDAVAELRGQPAGFFWDQPISGLRLTDDEVDELIAAGATCSPYRS